MKDYYFYKVIYKLGSVVVTFEEFFTPQTGQVTYEMAQEICYKRAFQEIDSKGGTIQDFKFKQSHELELRSWEHNRVKEKAYKTSLAKNLNDALSFNHSVNK